MRFRNSRHTPTTPRGTEPSPPWYNMTFDFSTLLTQAGFPAPPPTQTNHTASSHHFNDTDSDSDPSYQPPLATPQPARPTRHSSRSTPNRHMRTHAVQPHRSSDMVLRNVTIVGICLTISLLFVHLFLYVAIFVVGILMPAWQTFKSLEARDRTLVVELTADDGLSEIITDTPQATNWQAYWIIAAIMFAMDGLIMSLFIKPFLPGPLYHAGIFALVTWLTRGGGGNAKLVYDLYIRPTFLKWEEGVDHVTDKVVRKLDDATRHAAGAIHDVMAPYARHLEQIAGGDQGQREPVYDNRRTR